MVSARRVDARIVNITRVRLSPDVNTNEAEGWMGECQCFLYVNTIRLIMRAQIESKGKMYSDFTALFSVESQRVSGRGREGGGC